MNFDFHEAIEILERTPSTLESLLSGLSTEWLECNEGDGTWNASQVIDHMIAGERTNWVPRLEFLLERGEAEPFPAFDRFSHLNGVSKKSLEYTLHEFGLIRKESLAKLKILFENGLDLEKTGTHPAFGPVKARELISTWVVHDLTHISQVVRVMAQRYRTDVGPWIEYLGVLKK